MAGPEHERAAPPQRFVVTPKVGMPLSSAAARIEIKHLDAAKMPEVEVVLSASDSAGRTWAAHAMAPADFLGTLVLSVQVVDGSLMPGNASVQVTPPGADTSFAPSGLLKLRLEAGRLTGEASDMNDEFAAKFEGPFVVTCVVPEASMAVHAPTPTSDNALPPLVVDEKFESELCQRYTVLAGRSL